MWISNGVHTERAATQMRGRVHGVWSLDWLLNHYLVFYEVRLA